MTITSHCCFNDQKVPGTKHCVFLNFTVHVLVQQESSAVDMAFPKHSFLQALSVLLVASVLVRCQAPLEPEEEDEEEAAAAVAMAKSEPLECPPECSCTADGAVDCAGVDLTEFPADLHDGTRQLSLQVFHTAARARPHLISSAQKLASPQCKNSLLNLYLLSVFCPVMPEQQNCGDDSGAHFPSASARDAQPSEQLAHHQWYTLSDSLNTEQGPGVQQWGGPDYTHIYCFVRIWPTQHWICVDQLYSRIP